MYELALTLNFSGWALVTFLYLMQSLAFISVTQAMFAYAVIDYLHSNCTNKHQRLYVGGVAHALRNAPFGTPLISVYGLHGHNWLSFSK